RKLGGLLFPQPRLAQSVEIEIIHPFVAEARVARARERSLGMPREKLPDRDSRLVDAAKMSEGRGTDPTGDNCIRRDCHRAPSPADALLEATRKEMRNRCDRKVESSRLVVERVHALRYLELSYRLVTPAADAVDRAGPVAHEGRVRVHLDRPLGKLARLLEAAGEKPIGERGGGKACTVVRSHGKGAACILAGLIERSPPAALIPTPGYAGGNG